MKKIHSTDGPNFPSIVQKAQGSLGWAVELFDVNISKSAYECPPHLWSDPVPNGHSDVVYLVANTLVRMRGQRWENSLLCRANRALQTLERRVCRQHNCAFIYSSLWSRALYKNALQKQKIIIILHVTFLKKLAVWKILQENCHRYDSIHGIKMSSFSPIKELYYFSHEFNIWCKFHKDKDVENILQ